MPLLRRSQPCWWKVEAEVFYFEFQSKISFRPMTISHQETPREKDGSLVIDQQTQVKTTNKKRPGILSPPFVFAILLIPRLVAARYSIIGDCDEGINPRSTTEKLSRISLQLLGTYSLSCSWQWLPNMGIFSLICNTQLVLHCNSCRPNQVTRFVAIYKGRFNYRSNCVSDIVKVQQFYGLRIVLAICIRILRDCHLFITSNCTKSLQSEVDLLTFHCVSVLECLLHRRV